MFAGQKILLKQGDTDGPKKRIAVIGAGVAGLVAMKTALESGHDVVCFERLRDIGGIWNFECCGSKEGNADIHDPEVHCYPSYSSLVTNTSAYMTMFSDFMPLVPKDCVFQKHTDICSYLKSYANHFNLQSKIRFETHVQDLEKQNDKWQVLYKNGDGKEKRDHFDFVMICTGAFGFPHHVQYDGKDDFKGVMIHSGQVRNGGALFRDKRVMIVGGAYSGAEMMAMALTNGAKKVYVNSTHRPDKKNVWCIDRYVDSVHGDKRPWDYCMNRENAIDNPIDFGTMLSQWCYPFHKNQTDATLQYPRDTLALTNLKEVKKGIERGALEFIDRIEKFGEHGATLCNGIELSDIDVVVFATGYDPKFPFLNKIWPRDEQGKCELYNYILPPKQHLDGLAFILVTPSGFPLFPFAEMQSRWFMQRIAPKSYDANGCIFDTQERKHMENTLALKHKQREGLGVRFNYIDNLNLMIDTLACDIGVQPPDYKALVASGDEKSAELGVAIAYGPLSGLQYRLQGPHMWPQAASECVAFAKELLGKHFDEYLAKAKANDYQRSGCLDPKNGPYNLYH